MFLKVLENCEQYRGEYSEDRPISQHAHIQTERNGGIKAWNKLCALLLNPPTETQQQDNDESE